MTPQERQETEAAQREAVVAINSEAADRAALEALHGQVWDPEELRKDFEILAFAAPLIVARRKSDGKTCTLYFRHAPRFYFDCAEDNGQ